LWNVTRRAKTARFNNISAIEVNALCGLPDDCLASGGNFETGVLIWNLKSGKRTATLRGHSDGIYALCPLPDGRLASGSWDKTIRLWDLRHGTLAARLRNLVRGAQIARLEGHSSSVGALCMLPNGRLASGSGDGSIGLWDLTASGGTQIALLRGHTGSVDALCVLHDHRLASGSLDRIIRLWDLTNAAEIGSLEGHAGGVTGLCLLSDGRLVSCSGDHTIRLWDLSMRIEISRLEVDAPVKCLVALTAVSGSRMVAGDELGRLHWLEVVD
jgi:WD40 repeat protein